MDLIESIKLIREAKEDNRLVVFVGAGVSKNSDIPTWHELIREIAKKIHYSRCDYCKRRNEKCTAEECKERYTYTQEELLRIPEYYYQSDTSENHHEYYKLISDALSGSSGSNLIDDEVFNLLPHHIITTNYDCLLERSNNVNAQLYTVVGQDSDLLSRTSERYIIKMHGSLEKPESIVLKESDYINYEQNYPLISTLIRSLLINHTFIFLGYSLNDYNLNLIIGWINYFGKFYDIKERPKSILVNSHAPSEYERRRLESKNIYTINTSELPETLQKKMDVSVGISNESGRNLLLYLRSITDSRLLQNHFPLEAVINENYKVLDSYRKISYKDLIQVQPFGNTAFYATELMLYDNTWYENVAELLREGHPKLTEVFKRAGISAILHIGEGKREEIPVEEEQQSFRLCLDNAYCELADNIESETDISAKIYYSYLLGTNLERLEKLVSIEANEQKAKDYISLMLHKTRARLVTIDLFNRQSDKAEELKSLFKTAPARYQNAAGFLNMLLTSSDEDILKMKDLAEKQEKRYRYDNHTLYSSHCFENIWKIQAYVYDYYYFFKKNYLPLDYFNDPKDYFKSYLSAILCTCASSTDIIGTAQRGNTSLFHPALERYPLNEIDVDILTKYTKPETLREMLKKYSIQRFELDNDLDIIKKFNNLCESFARFKRREWIDYLTNFVILTGLLELKTEEENIIVHTFSVMINNLMRQRDVLAYELIELVDCMVNYHVSEDTHAAAGELLDALLLNDGLLTSGRTNIGLLTHVVGKLAPYVKEETVQRAINLIDETEETKDKMRRIVVFRSILPIERYAPILSDNLEELDIYELFHVVVEKIVPYSERVLQKYLQVIEQEDKTRIEHPHMRSFPDHLTAAIEECVLFKVIGADIDLTALAPYAHYSEPLQFMLDPENFDYTKVDTGNYMWQNFFRSTDYRDYLIAHKQSILTENLKQVFKAGVATEEQKKIVYGMLLDKSELSMF